ncbi:DUF397 domain-containing protein [Streptomyces spectabilis]|uniref:DUF397 domain-containing protein n=1 Tax=Streptomyces spectabilis TaxID=68270 RepID=A0A5P2XGC2_STRST|nr:DUF397 domain-containing protein [Streptomyces spectabilis]MBB5105016.1 hypothetical protein [Streptomyces spectabilis]MCI3905746.1 DUF397 domain-containing protein [Streptomyces spectabilis]QEV62694.1 DUF397 domain-containing protein [Streptomyces spectabilis]GGV06884.1 toxin [Streptomyces spectabilis]
MSNSIALEWFKSSYSGDEGGECLEVAYAWRKSSYSDEDGQACLEVATGPTAIHIRDSKDPNRGHLRVTPATWTAFLALPQRRP